MNRAKRCALLLVALMLLMPFSSAEKEGLPDPEESDLEQFNQEIVELLDRWDIPGAQLVVIHNGSLVYRQGYGMSDVEAGAPVENNSRFRLASLSKAVTSASILTLIQDGTLTLEDKMVDHIPHLMPNAIEGCDYPNHPTEYSLEDVTISQLLNHRGGWDVTSDPTYWHWDSWHSREGPCIDRDGLNQSYDHGNSAPLPMERVLREWLRHPLDYEPGTQYVYSNIGYQILGQIIEYNTGMSYEAYAQQHVLAPMGITSMQIGMTLLSHRAANEVLYYDYENDTGPCQFPSDGDDQGHPIFEIADDPYCGDFVIEEKDGGGGWIGSATDYAKFIAHLDGTLTSSAFNDSFEWFIGNPDAPAAGSYYGRGVGIGSTDTSHKTLESLGIPLLKQGVVGGITGVMMGESRRREVDVMAILAESDGSIGGGLPDARAAARIIECLDELIPAVHLDSGPLLEEAQRIEGEIRDMMAVHLNPPADSGDSLGSMYG